MNIKRMIAGLLTIAAVAFASTQTSQADALQVSPNVGHPASANCTDANYTAWGGYTTLKKYNCAWEIPLVNLYGDQSYDCYHWVKIYADKSFTVVANVYDGWGSLLSTTTLPSTGNNNYGASVHLNINSVSNIKVTSTYNGTSTVTLYTAARC